LLFVVGGVGVIEMVVYFEVGVVGVGVGSFLFVDVVILGDLDVFIVRVCVYFDVVYGVIL